MSERIPQQAFPGKITEFLNYKYSSIEEDIGAGTIKGQFDTKIRGKVLGDRSQILVAINSAGNDDTSIAIEVYPINPVGQKLMFGGREGVSQTVASWFWAHLEHNLG